MAAVLSFNGKSLEDFEHDIQKWAADKGKGGDKDKGFPYFKTLALPAVAANAAVNIGAVGADGIGRGLATMDSNMSADDKHVGNLEQRKRIIDNALAQLRLQHPELN